MNELQIFQNEEFGTIRTVTIDNEPWFVGKDVAGILGYANQNEAIQDHVDEDDKLNSKTLSSQGLELGQRGGGLRTTRTHSSRGCATRLTSSTVR